jgi:tellurite resistance protein
MRQTVRLRIQAAGNFTPSPEQLGDTERRLVFRAVQTVIESDGFLAQPGADMLVSLRSELNLASAPDLGDELTFEELEETRLDQDAADYLCYMALLAGYADGVLSESESAVIDGFCGALGIDAQRRAEIESACKRAILEANVLMNLTDVIASSELAQRYREELGLDEDALERVADSILQSLAEA